MRVAEFYREFIDTKKLSNASRWRHYAALCRGQFLIDDSDGPVNDGEDYAYPILPGDDYYDSDIDAFYESCCRKPSYVSDAAPRNDFDEAHLKALPQTEGAMAQPSPSMQAISKVSICIPSKDITDGPQPTMTQSQRADRYFALTSTHRDSYTLELSASQRYDAMPSFPCTPGEEALRFYNALYWFLMLCASYS